MRDTEEFRVYRFREIYSADSLNDADHIRGRGIWAAVVPGDLFCVDHGYLLRLVP